MIVWLFFFKGVMGNKVDERKMNNFRFFKIFLILLCYLFSNYGFEMKYIVKMYLCLYSYFF